MNLPGETEAGSAGRQPCRGITWRAHRADVQQRGNTMWDEGRAAVLGMSVVRLGICRPNDWSGYQCNARAFVASNPRDGP